jgi:AcrR family transcriptional regulator
VAQPIRSGDDLLAGVESLGSIRGRPRALIRDEALKVALELINREGLAALTLRRLATELGVGSATVHSTFGGKEPLLQALADTVFAVLPDTENLTADKPEDALIQYLTAAHRMLVSQPAIAQLTVIRRMHNRNLFRAQETILELLRECGLDGQIAWDAYDALTNYLFGFSLNRISRQDFDRRQVISELPAEEFPAVRSIGPYFDQREPEQQLQACLRGILAGFCGEHPEQ